MAPATILHTASLAERISSRLADAPPGNTAMYEAALLWSQHRPACWRTLGPPSPTRHIAIAHFDQVNAAHRLARLLSGLTWAVVNDGPVQAFSVGVPTLDCHRVTRSLDTALRRSRRLLTNAAAARQNQQLAAAAWRVAVLSAATEITANAIAVLAGDEEFRSILLAAAEALDLEPTHFRSRITGDTLVLNGRQQVRRLTELMMLCVISWPDSTARPASMNQAAACQGVDERRRRGPAGNL